MTNIMKFVPNEGFECEVPCTRATTTQPYIFLLPLHHFLSFMVLVAELCQATLQSLQPSSVVCFGGWFVIVSSIKPGMMECVLSQPISAN